MADVAKKITQIGPSEQISEPKADEKSWLRQKNEPALWYMRFKRYLDMGTKRSLRAVVAGEPASQKATKGTQKNSESKNLADVSIPGSWKRASKVWNWVDRAQAYDLAQIEKEAAHMRIVATRLPFSSKAYRLLHLNQMAISLFEQRGSSLSVDELYKYVARMQSLFRDIATEMEGIDKGTALMAEAAAYRHFMEQANSPKEKAKRDIEQKQENEKLRRELIKNGIPVGDLDLDELLKM